jgi:hypothetical protein
MPSLIHSWIAGGLVIMSVSAAYAGERQVTRDAEFNHELDDNDNFSPDDRFLVFDTRPVTTAIIASRVIAKTEIATGRIIPLYRPKNANDFGPGLGAVSFAPNRDEVIFIHGPLHPTSKANQYEQYRRVGALVAGDGSGRIRFADARNTKPPYTPGALRGGTHAHEFSGDGNWIGFTYNDAVVREHGLKIGKNLDLRTIGVTRLGKPVHVPPQDQFADHAEGFSAVVVVVKPDPAPGSDEISRAAGDSWVGARGYVKPDGRRQLARAFIGTTRDRNGKDLDELFIVDIPEDITRPGPLGPLEGTDSTFPMPPAGASQRRLTFMADAKFPGCQGAARSSRDGTNIAFRTRDDRGQWQIFLASPNGGRPRQATFIDGGVDGGARWHPSGKAIVCAGGTKVVATVVAEGPLFGKSLVLIDRSPRPFALVWSNDGKTIAYNRIVPTDGKDVTQIFVIDYPDRDGDGIPDALQH